MSNIKINELAKEGLSLSDLFIKSDLSGNASQNNLQALADLIQVTTGISFKGALAVADTPSVDGFYFANETGTYTNAGSLVTDLEDGLNIIVKESTNYSLVVVPLTQSTLSEVSESNTTTAVNGLAVYNEIIKTEKHAKESIAQYNSSLVYKGLLTVSSTEPSSPVQNDCYYIYNSANNTIFTGVIASSGQLVVYNNSAWEVHDIIPTRNRSYFKDGNKLGFGDFSYSSTVRGFENYVANSFVSLNAKKLPDDVLIKIAWFRLDGSSIRFRIYKSEDNGSTWVTFPNEDFNIESDGYTVIVNDYTEYLISFVLDLREVQALPSFHYYIVNDIDTEGNLIFNNHKLKILQNVDTKGFSITQDSDVTKLSGSITGGSDFTSNKTEVPIYITQKGTIRFKLKFLEDFYGSVKNDRILSFNSENGSLSYMQLSYLKPRADELWNQRMDSYIYFKEALSSEDQIIRPGGGLIENSNAYNINQGTLFAVRYVGSDASNNLDLRVSKTETTLLFHDGNAGSETNVRATFTISNYSTIEALINAIEANAWCSANIEVIFKAGILQDPTNITYVNATKLISDEVRVKDRTQKITTSLPASPEPGSEWEQVYDAFPVYFEKSTTNKEVELIITWNKDKLFCYLDGKPFRIENGTYTPFTDSFWTTLNINDGSVSAKITELEYKQEFTNPRGFFLPIEAHEIQHDYNDASGSALTMSRTRLTEIATMFNEKGWKCITASEFNCFKQTGQPLPEKTWLFISDDYRKDQFTNKETRNLMDKLGVRVSFNLIGSSNQPFVTDRDLWRSVINYGWDVHTHCEWHTETQYMSYDNLKLWIDDAKTVFDDNFLSNTIMTIPFSPQQIRIIKLLEHSGFNCIFTGAVTDYPSLNDVPHINNNAYIRILADDEVSLDNLKSVLDLFEGY